MHKGMIEEDVSSKNWEERKREKEALYQRLVALREEAILEGQKTYTVDEVMEMLAEDRAGGEGLNRAWNY
jgi:hypothetical protein